MVSLFGAMDLMIIIKWQIDWIAYEEEHPCEESPSIINEMITMFISVGVKYPDEGCDTGPAANLFGPNQTLIMQVLLLCALVSIPSMLLVKPCYLSRKSGEDEEHGDQEGDSVADKGRRLEEQLIK